MSDGLVPVRFIDFPVLLAARVSKHFEGIQRELALIDFANDATRAAVPARLLELAARVNADFQAGELIGRENLAATVASGARTVTIEARIPRSAAPSSVSLLAMLAEADAFCRDGALISSPMPPDCCAFRDWFLEELVNQIGGGEPTPWTGPVE